MQQELQTHRVALFSGVLETLSKREERNATARDVVDMEWENIVHAEESCRRGWCGRSPRTKSAAHPRASKQGTSEVTSAPRTTSRAQVTRSICVMARESCNERELKREQTEAKGRD